MEGKEVKIVTLEFQQTIQDLIDDVRAEQFSDSEEYKLALEYRALPLGFDFLAYFFLTSNGEVLITGKPGKCIMCAGLGWLTEEAYLQILENSK